MHKSGTKTGMDKVEEREGIRIERTRIKQSSAQAYAWFYWDLQNDNKDTKLHWIRRADKKEN